MFQLDKFHNVLAAQLDELTVLLTRTNLNLESMAHRKNIVSNNDISMLPERSSGKPELVDGIVNGINGCQIDKCKVLMLADSQDRYMTSKLIKLFKDTCTVQTILKPNAMYLDVISDAQSLTDGFCDHDYVVILADTSNVMNRNALEIIQFDKIVSSLTHTNVIMVTVPLTCKGKQYNDEASRFNAFLHNYYLTNCKL